MNPRMKIRMASHSALAWIVCLLLITSVGSLQGQEKEDAKEREKQRLKAIAADREQAAKKKKDERYMVVLTIGDQEVTALRRDGYLRATLPSKFRNRVDSVVLKHPTTFLKKKLVIRDDVDKSGGTLIVNMDESIVDRLEYQPIQMKVYQSGFDSITLKYQRPTNRGRLAPRGRGSKPKPNDSPQVFVRLSPQNGTTGWIRNMQTLEVETQFGSTKIPLNRIRGIRFNAPDKNQVVVISVTGDYLTGTIDFDDIVLATRWGDERIPVSKMESISYHRDSRFLESPKEADRRWTLTQPVQPATPGSFPARIPSNPVFRGLPNRNF